MTNPGPHSSPKKLQSPKKANPASPFRLGKAVTSIAGVASPHKTTMRVMTSLPLAEFINSLWKLDSALGNKIADCLNNAYSHITQRGAHGQGESHFFHHSAATAIFESYEDLLIKGKNHGIKSAGILNAVSKTLELIHNKLSSPRPFSQEQRRILENAQAELLAHQKALGLAIQALPALTKEHLKVHQNMDVANLSFPQLSPTKAQRVKILHPDSPQTNRTPKKLNRKDRLAQLALQATDGPLDLAAAEAASRSPVKPRPVAAPVQGAYADVLKLLPRTLKKPGTASSFSVAKEKLATAAPHNALALMGAESDPIPAIEFTSPKAVTFLMASKTESTAPKSPKGTPANVLRAILPTSPKKTKPRQ